MSKYGRLSTKQTIAIARYVDEQGYKGGDEREVSPIEIKTFFKWKEGASDEALHRLVNDLEPDRQVSLDAVRRARQQAGGVTFDEWRRSDEGKAKLAERTVQLNLPQPTDTERAIEVLDTVVRTINQRIDRLETRMTNIESGVQRFPQLFSEVTSVRNACGVIRDQLEGLAKHVESRAQSAEAKH